MKRTMMCLLAVAFSFVLSLNSAWAQADQPVKIDASLSIIAGQVKLTRVGSTNTDVITQGVELYAGDLLETLRESKAVISYDDGTVMRIKERTLIEVQPVSLKVFKGKTWYKFTKRGTEFKIETPTLVAGIRGTQFEVAVSSHNKTTLSVTEGAVAVKGGQNDRSLLVKAGYATSCAEEGNLAMPYTFSVENKNAEWSGAEWNTASGTEDEYSLMIKYLNLKNEYGEEDSRTLEAKQRYTEYKAKLNK